jgi:tRNA nucleotidyltransferase (CCA-adding enzyme)
MDLVLCHTTADFDTLGAAVGITRLQPGTRIVLAGGCHPTVYRFLSLYRDQYPLIERRAVVLDQVASITVVDTQQRDRLGPVAAWLDSVRDRGGDITLYDHHGSAPGNITATHCHVEPVGAATTLVAEQLQRQTLSLTPAEATVMALGIHVDTGSLTFERTTPRDASALAWLMAQGATQRAIAEFVEPALSPQLQGLLETALAQVHRENHQGYTLAWVQLPTEGYVPGLSGVCDRLMGLIGCDILLLAAPYAAKSSAASPQKLTLIGRAQGRIAATATRAGVDWQQIFQPWGGGGHASAAAAALITEDPEGAIAQVLAQVRQQIPIPPTAQAIMSAPVRTIRPQTLIKAAQRLLLRYGHSGLSVVNQSGQLVGIISRRDIDLALHHGFGHAPVKGYMSTDVKTITPATPLGEIEALMVAHDIGRLPVMAGANLLGMVTRTDVLRQRHASADLAIANKDSGGRSAAALPVSLPAALPLLTRLQRRLPQTLWEILQIITQTAVAQGWHLYLVGGAVRDLLLDEGTGAVALADVDLVVDSAHQSLEMGALEMGAGVVLAQAVQTAYPQVELQIYGRFQTAALVWHPAPETDSPTWMVDIATARTEFYPYPAANPEVEASSIQQDLYRRDFTINAMALRLTEPQAGQLLDFFGGGLDLQQRQVRVLHANSFIEDPTRIYRAVRFAVRLGFTLDPQTEGFMRYAITSGIYTQLQRDMVQLPALQTRLKSELKYILAAPYWQRALHLLDRLGALVCLHSDLTVSAALWAQIRRVSRWLARVDLLQALVPWQTRLEVILAAIAPADRQTVAQNLQLPQASCDRLGQLAEAEATLSAALAQPHSPSLWYQRLQTYDLGLLILMGGRHPQTIGTWIWRYLREWSQVTAPLNGHDLQRLGYTPGPQYRQLLDHLLAATLDGEIHGRADAKRFLSQHYPLSVALPVMEDQQDTQRDQGRH